MRTILSASKGFTLVETVLALGVISFAIVAILGLLSVSASTGRDSDRDTMLVSMFTQVMADLRTAPFDALWLADPHAGELVDSAPAVDPGDPVDTVYYFTGEGVLIPSKERTPEAAYRCTVKKTPDASTRGYSQTEFNLMNLHLLFQSPVSAPVSSRNATSIYTTVARY